MNFVETFLPTEGALSPIMGTESSINLVIFVLSVLKVQRFKFHQLLPLEVLMHQEKHLIEVGHSIWNRDQNDLCSEVGKIRP